MRASVPVLLLWSLPLLASTPANALAAVAADRVRQPRSGRDQQAYFSLYAIPPKARPLFMKAFVFHLNSLSSEADLLPVVQVNADLLRIDLRDLGEGKQRVWEVLKRSDPFFPLDRDPPVLRRPGEVPVLGLRRVRVAYNTTYYVTRADWFLYWTAQQKDRGGAGYYQWLGVTNRKDAEELAGLDIKAAKKRRLEIAAIVAESGVALNNRAIVRYGTLPARKSRGGWWETLDVKTSTGRQNSLRLLNGDFKPDVLEVYFVLPNGLFGLLALNADGTLQETVPDDIAGNSVSTSNDKRIHAGTRSCVACHVEGIRPIDDWARKVYKGPVQLTSPDYEKLKRLQRLYLSDLEFEVKEDQRSYGIVLQGVNGLTPAANAAAYTAVLREYAEVSLTLETTALELGVGVKEWTACLKGYGSKGVADPVLLGLLADPSMPIRREHWDELYPVATKIVKEFRP